MSNETTPAPPQGYESPYKFQPKFNLEREDLPTAVGQMGTATPSIHSKAQSFGGGFEEINSYILNWPNKHATSTPGPVSSGICDLTKRNFTGTNLATQDYMSMCGDEEAITYLKSILEKGNFVGGVGGSRAPTKAEPLGHQNFTDAPLIKANGQFKNQVQVGAQTEVDHLEATVEWYFDELLWLDAQPGKNTRSIDEIKKLRSQGETKTGAKAYAKVFATGWLAGYGCLTGKVFA